MFMLLGANPGVMSTCGIVSVADMLGLCFGDECIVMYILQ